MNDIQDQIRLFCLHHGLIADPRTRLLDLSSELGEIAKEVLKTTAYGRDDFASTEELCEETGDLLFALVQFANEAGIDLDASLKTVMRKYDERIRDRGDAGSGR